MAETGSTFEGWTLREAMQRCVDPQEFRYLKKAQENSNAIGKPARRFSRGVFSDHYDDRYARHARDTHVEQTRKHREVLIAERDIQSAFRSVLSEGRLIVTGRRDSPVAEPTRIPKSAWGDLTFFDMQKSKLREISTSKTVIHDVRLYPIVRSPEAASIIAGSSLVEAFRSCVFGDPEVEAQSKEAIRTNPKWEKIVSDGIQIDRPMWDATWGRRILSFYTEPSEWGFMVLGTPEEERAVESALADRFSALTTLLAKGELLAEGLAVANGRSDVVPRTLWDHDDSRFDVVTGDFYGENYESTGSRFDRHVKLWNALIFKLPQTSDRSHSSELILKDTSPSLEALATTQTPTTARASKECLSWLKAEIAKSPNRRPMAKSAWKQTAMEKWPGRLSARAFDRCWAQAIDETGAIAWSSAGAPRKKSNQRTD